MDLSFLEHPAGRAVFAQAVKGIRRKRDLKAHEVAQRMGLPVRTYELFETGGGSLSSDRIRKFAEATDSDPFALVLSVVFGDAEFAISCANAKLAMIIVMLLGEFFEEHSSDLRFLDPTAFIKAFRRAFDELGSSLDEGEAFLQRWFEDRTSLISLEALSIRGVRKRKT